MAACPLVGSQTTQPPTGLPCNHSRRPQPITSPGEAPSSLWGTPLTPILDKKPLLYNKRERERANYGKSLSLYFLFSLICTRFFLVGATSTYRHTHTHKHTRKIKNSRKINKAGVEKASKCGMCRVQVSLWFTPSRHYVNVCVGCEWRHFALVSPSISVTDPVRAFRLGRKFTEGSHSDSGGIVSRMWLTRSVFSHLAFDLRHASVALLV